MKFQHYLNENNIFTNIIAKVLKQPWNQAKKTLQNAYQQFVDIVRENGLEQKVLSILNKHLKTKQQTLDIGWVVENKELNEGILKDLWKKLSFEMGPVFTFYPALTVWMEIDKLIKGLDPDYRIITTYSVFWFIIVAGRFTLDKIFKEKDKSEKGMEVQLQET